MPEWMWIIIAITGVATTAVLLWIISRRGVSAKYGRTSIVIDGRYEETGNPLSRALQYVQRSTPEIQHKLFSIYLRLMKQAGALPDFLADYDDARFVRILLRYLVNGGNGSRSIQKIIEDELVHGEWRREEDDLREYVRTEVWPPILRSAKDIINQEYDTTVLEHDGTRRQRWVSNTDFIDELSSNATRDLIVEEIVPLFAYAKRCVAKNGCEG